ncbi:SoxW family protein [Cupriavidus necator]
MPANVALRASARLCSRWLSVCALVAATGAQAVAGTTHLAAATDLAAHGAEAARRGEPVVVLVSMPGCSYCETVRRNYLGPQAAAGEIAVVRELDMTADTPLRDADGNLTTARAWARTHQVRVAPTVLFLDRQGRAAATPLRGVQPDFYGAYLEQALDQARAAVATRH